VQFIPTQIKFLATPLKVKSPIVFVRIVWACVLTCLNKRMSIDPLYAFVCRQVLHSSVDDLLSVYRRRAVTEKRLERGEGLCDRTSSSRLACINAKVFRVLERMAARSTSLVRRINRILPPDTDTRREVPATINVDKWLLKHTAGKLVRISERRH